MVLPRSAGTPGYRRRERVQSATLGPNFKETINGFSYGHTPGITMRVGQRVRWYAMGSTNFEFHTPHWHGNVVTANHMRRRRRAAADGYVRPDMVPDNAEVVLPLCRVVAPAHGHAGVLYRGD